MSIVKHVSALAMVAVAAVACAKFEVRKNSSDAVITPNNTPVALSIAQATNSFMGSPSDDMYRIDFVVRDEANNISARSEISGLGSAKMTKDGVGGAAFTIETKCVTGACDTYGILVTRVVNNVKSQVFYYFKSGNRQGNSAVLHSNMNSNYPDLNAALVLVTIPAQF